jgi:hypothetical protein
MDRKQACLTQSEVCRGRAEADPLNREFWMAEASRWKKAAEEKMAPLAVSHEIRDGRMIKKPG